MNRGIMGVVVALVVILAFLVIFVGILDPIVSDPAVDTETVTTGVAETTGTVTLATVHFFTDTTQMTVSCVTDTAPGFTLAANRLTVNLTGLTVSTVQVCTTNFVTPDTDTWVPIAELIPLFASVAALGLALGGVAAGAGAAGLGGAVGARASAVVGPVNMQALVTALIAVVLIPVIVLFVDDADADLVIRPEYTGAQPLLAIVVIGYVIGTFSLFAGLGAQQLGFGGGSGGGSRRRRRRR